MITFKFNRNGKDVLINCSCFPKDKRITAVFRFFYNDDKERIEFDGIQDSLYYNHETREWIEFDSFEDESENYLDCVSILIT